MSAKHGDSPRTQPSALINLRQRPEPRSHPSSSNLPTTTTSLLPKALASLKLAQFSISDNCWDTTLDCGSAWNTPPESESHNSLRPNSRHNSLTNWLLPHHHSLLSCGSSTGTSFIDSSVDDDGLYDPSIPIPGFATGDFNETPFSSPALQYLPCDGDFWDEGAYLEPEYGLYPLLPPSTSAGCQPRQAMPQLGHIPSGLSMPTASSMLTQALTAHPKQAFFSHDVNTSLAPANERSVTRTDGDAVFGENLELEALLENIMSSPANVAAMSTPSSSSTSTSPPPKPSPSITVSKPTTPPKSSPPATNRVTKEFHFVANSDKAGAARVRNTMASRKHRQSKVNRIAELERLLAEAEGERDMWKQRALKSHST